MESSQRRNAVLGERGAHRDSQQRGGVDWLCEDHPRFHGSDEGSGGTAASERRADEGSDGEKSGRAQAGEFGKVVARAIAPPVAEPGRGAEKNRERPARQPGTVVGGAEDESRFPTNVAEYEK